MDNAGLRALLEQLAREYPPEMVAGQLRDIPRIAFNIQLAMRAVAPRDLRQARICDLGGGLGLFSVGCAAAGFGQVVLVDDFQDDVNRRLGDSPLALHRRRGVQVVSADVLGEQFTGDCLKDSDVITCFESMEHWHNSPKRLFAQVMAALRPGGAFILSVPNCASLRRRLTVPLGRGRWSRMQDWYESPIFRGHVREPDVSDLHYIARDLGLVNVRFRGRNWPGRASPKPAIRLAARLTDRVLRLRPSLCAHIYLVGHKQAVDSPAGPPC